MAKYDWNYFREKARPVVGGIKAQTERGEIVKNWWAKRWLTALETFETGGRLARGRAYARKGQVISIDIREGHVSAVVQGSLPQPYNVEIEVRTIPHQKWLELSQTSFSQPATAARLITGEMPEDIDKLFAERKLSLFPTTMDDLKTFCSCPDVGNPCKHIAAVYYLLGEEFDRDPFLIFRLRGMSKEELLGMLVGVSQQSVFPDFCEDETERDRSKRAKSKKGKGKSSGAGSKIAKPVPLPVDATLFWHSTPVTQDLAGPVKVPPSSAALAKSLGNLPFWRSHENLASCMERFYSHASESAISKLSDLTSQRSNLESVGDLESE